MHPLSFVFWVPLHFYLLLWRDRHNLHNIRDCRNVSWSLDSYECQKILDVFGKKYFSPTLYQILSWFRNCETKSKRNGGFYKTICHIKENYEAIKVYSLKESSFSLTVLKDQGLWIEMIRTVNGRPRKKHNVEGVFWSFTKHSPHTVLE